ncbi:hypothetical protein [Specibacter cremeus]|uniref:hypothetical protein n=1 Tax=Specibacter cremeus TaxID=1629051 RepID=UPI000F772704|nr:hypothetical protein [Specibacter cremeus]
MDVAEASDQVPWATVIGALGPLTILLAALIAAVVAWVAYREQRAADRRSAWWDRAQWALSASLSTDVASREVGLGVLDVLAHSRLAGPEEAEILAVAAIRELDATRPVAGVAPAAVPPDEQRVRIRAARLQVTTDHLRGEATEAWIKDLARSDL